MKKQTDQEFSHGFGKMIKGKSSLLLENDELSDTQNMQPGFGWKQRRGMSELTSAAVATGLRFKSLAHFRVMDESTNCLLAHTYDSVNGERIMRGSALPPNAITWAEMYDLTADCETVQWANVAKAIVMANNKDFLIWKGDVAKPSGVFFYDDTTGGFVNYYDETTDDDTDTSMPLNLMVKDVDFVYVVSEIPLEKVTPTIGNINVSVADLQMFIFTGSWVMLREGKGEQSLGDNRWNRCTSLSVPDTWADEGGGSGSVIATTFDNRNVFKLDSGAGGGSGDYAAVNSTDFDDWGGAGARTVLTMVCYHAATGTKDDTDYFFMQINNYNGSVVTYLMVTDTEIWRYNDTEWILVPGATPVIGAWTTYTMDIQWDGSASTCTLYQDGVALVSDYNCHRTLSSSGEYISIRHYGYTNANRITYLSSVILGTTLGDDGDDFVDGTQLNGKTHGKSGDITWTPRTGEVPTTIEGIPGYAYRYSPSLNLDAEVSVTEMAVYSPLTPVPDIWDGMPRTCTGCYVYDGTDHTDYTAYVNNYVEAQSADLSGATTSYAFYVGFAERMTAIDFFIPSESPNDAVSVIDAVFYHDNSGAEASVGTFTDTTKVGAKSFVQKGRVSWSEPGKTNEKMTTIAGDSTPMFWYKIEWSATLSDPMGVYFIAGVPVGNNPSACYGCFAYKRRAWQLAPIGDENAVRFSASNLPTVWNGMDSGYVFFGERPLRAAAPFYNETVIYADTEMWMLQGNAPVNFGRLRLSATVGISAVQSLVSVESGVNVNDSIKVLLTWQFNDGFWLFDGVRIWKISAPDIDSFFDPDHDDYINPAYLDQTSGAYDFTNQLVMWTVYSGATATTPTKVLVLHVPSMWYGIFDYGTDVGTILSVINNKMYMVGGGFNNGKFYLLDTGKTDVDTSGTVVAVDAYATTRDMKVGWGDGIKQRLFSLWAESEADGGLIEVDEYPDGLETPVPVGEQSMTWLGKIFGAFQKHLKVYPGQKTSKFRIRNRSKNARMKLIGYSTTVDKGRANE